jgi:hypothetical protein
MRNIPFSQSVRTLSAVLIPLVAGCGGSGDGVTVSGTVTFNGKPVDKGYVNFHPTDNKGRSVGGEVRDGKFTVKNVAPGKCRVEVIETPTTEAPDNMGDSIKNAKEKKGANEPSRNLVAANSEGNNQVHEIASGTELALTLKASDSMGAPQKPNVSNSMPPIKGR